MPRYRLPLADTTIPRKAAPEGNAAQRQAVPGPVQGRFVDYGGGTIVLTDMHGANVWPLERVRMLSGSFGFSDEGLERAPRPWKFAGDVPLIEGDWFLIVFLGGDAGAPCVLGGVRSLKPADPTFFHGQPVGQDPNPIRFRAHLQDPNSGAVTGTLQVRALDGGANLEIIVGGGTFGTGVRIAFDGIAGSIKIGLGLETHPVPLGDVIVQALMDLATDIVAVNVALPSLTPVPTLNATQILLDGAQSLATGAPMLSTIVSTQ